MEYLQQASDITIVIYIVSSMVLVGLSQPFADVMLPLKDVRLVLRLLLVNFVAAPLLAFLLVRFIPLQPAHETGLLLLGCAAGAPFIPKLAEVAGGNIAQAVAVMVLLMLGTIFFLPFALPWIMPGLTADPMSIAKPLVFLLFLPLTLGFVFNKQGHRALPFLRKFTSFAFVLLITLLIGANLESLWATIGSFAIGTYALFVFLLVMLGYLFAGLEARRRDVFALASGQRNTSAALVVAVENLHDPAVAVMVIVGAIVGLVVLLAVSRYFRFVASKSI